MTEEFGRRFRTRQEADHYEANLDTIREHDQHLDAWRATDEYKRLRGQMMRAYHAGDVANDTRFTEELDGRELEVMLETCGCVTCKGLWVAWNLPPEIVPETSTDTPF